MTTPILTEEEAKTLLAQPVLKPKPKLGNIQVYSVTEQDPYFNGILIFGPAKIGKSVLAGSAAAVPQMSPVILIDYDDGTLSLRKTYPNVDAVRVHTMAESDAVYESLFQAGRKNAADRYKTVIVDSLYQMRAYLMRECMADVVSSLTEAEREKQKRIIEAPSMREFGIVLDRMHEQVKKWRELPNTHVIFTCWSSKYTDEETGKTVIAPDLQGKAAFQIPGRMDEVYYYSMRTLEGKPTRVLQTQGTEKVLAGSRDGQMPPAIINPTMTDIYDILVQKSKEPT